MCYINNMKEVKNMIKKLAMLTAVGMMLTGCYATTGQVKKDMIMQAAQYFFKRVQEEFNCDTVTLERRKKWEGFLGGSAGARARGATR